VLRLSCAAGAAEFSDRRLAGTGVTATVLHPGVVNSGFGAEDPSQIFKLLVPLWRPFMKSPLQGAATSIYLASSPEVEGATGIYFANRRPQSSSKRSYDESAAGRLWRVSARLVDLDGESAGLSNPSARPR
jgi:hypothetical protein